MSTEAATVPERADTTQTEIAIIGAGFAGVGLALALRREGREDFAILERADALGGTWRDNSYPGCGCDIPSVLYSYRQAPNPDWSRAFAPQPEIRDYLQGVAARHDIERFIRYGHELIRADFDPARGVWELETAGGRLTASVLVSAAGPLADPAIPALPGFESFAGTSFHSSRWKHEHPLAGARVGVIGTGASAIQFVPEIQPQVGHLTLFQRTPPWVLPRANAAIPESWRRRFARHPWTESLARAGVFSMLEATHVGFGHPVVMRGAEWVGRRHIAAGVADPELRARLTPDYRLGCKRVLFSDRWYPALGARNTEVVSAGIREVVADGIVDVGGVHHQLDTIIFGTGFRATDPPVAERIHGGDGCSLADAWDGSPRAHLGITVAGFPNLCFLLGPNTGLGNNSVLLMMEAQIAYVSRLLRFRAQRGAQAMVEPTPAAQAEFVAEVERAMDGSVWAAGGCASWYIDRTGRNSTLWPGTVRRYQRRVAHFDPTDYVTRRPGVAGPAAGEPALA
jgi:cation diffusion facilitator CzcD-associated flavoprotein CzcO